MRSSRTSRAVLGLAVLAAPLLSCVSDQRIVANTTAAYVYLEQQYEWDCVEVKGPETCKDTQAALKEARRQTELANKVYQIGKLPKQQRAKLKAVAKSLEAKK